MMSTSWTSFDTWTAITAAIVAMSCALPGTFLVLRRQSMLGDALSHTALPGIVVAFLIGHWGETAGWWNRAEASMSLHVLLLAGAVAAGLLTALLTESVQKAGGIDHSAALGVVYTSLFALGLLLVSLYADSVHLDADCVLFGQVERATQETVGNSPIPQAALINGVVLLLNAGLILLAFKEIRLATFDPELGASVGISSGLMHYALMAVSSMTLVAAFESVGVILVVTMLVVPGVTALLIQQNLPAVLLTAVVIAGLSAVLGHASTLVLPELLFHRMGLTTVDDVGTAGMTALVSGGFFVLALLFSPRRGALFVLLHRGKLALRIACEDILGSLYRKEEQQDSVPLREPSTHSASRFQLLLHRMAMQRLQRRGLINADSGTAHLTEPGRLMARHLVRSHRLFESYMARHFPLADDHLHETASVVEHFVDEPLAEEISRELDRPGQDPHGRSIPEN